MSKVRLYWKDLIILLRTLEKMSKISNLMKVRLCKRLC